jgi:hypothetical membrane protein
MENDLNSLQQQNDKRPWLSVGGLILALLGWISIPLYPASDNTSTFMAYIYISIAIAIIAFALCFAGRRQAKMLAKIGMAIAAALLLFMLIPLSVEIFV